MSVVDQERLVMRKVELSSWIIGTSQMRRYQQSFLR